MLSIEIKEETVPTLFRSDSATAPGAFKGVRIYQEQSFTFPIENIVPLT